MIPGPAVVVPGSTEEVASHGSGRSLLKEEYIRVKTRSPEKRRSSSGRPSSFRALTTRWLVPVKGFSCRRTSLATPSGIVSTRAISRLERGIQVHSKGAQTEFQVNKGLLISSGIRDCPGWNMNRLTASSSGIRAGLTPNYYYTTTTATATATATTTTTTTTAMTTVTTTTPTPSCFLLPFACFPLASYFLPASC